MKYIIAVAAALAVLLLAPGAAAEPPNEIPTSPSIDLSVPLHVLSPSELVTDGGAHVRLPPGYFLSEPVWNILGTEVKRLQEAETRLEAENEVLLKRARDRGSWLWYAGAFATGIAAGWALSK